MQKNSTLGETPQHHQNLTSVLILNDMICVISLMLNIMAVVSINRSNRRMKSIDFIMVSLTITNILYIGTLEVSRSSIIGKSGKVDTNAINKILLTTLHVLQCSHLLLLALLRLVSVRFPIKARLLLSIKNTKTLLIIFWVVFMVMLSTLITLSTQENKIDRKIFVATVTLVSQIFIIATGTALLTTYSATVYLLRHREPVTKNSPTKQYRVVCVCLGLLFSFFASFMVPACYFFSVKDGGILVWHFKRGWNVVVGLDLILQPCIYNMNTLVIRIKRSRRMVTDQFQKAMRWITSQGMVLPTTNIRQNKQQ